MCSEAAGSRLNKQQMKSVPDPTSLTPPKKNKGFGNTFDTEYT